MLPTNPIATPGAAQPAAAARARQSPLLARAALLAYFVLLTYGSLAPWQGWRPLGVHPLAFLIAPWPAFVTGFDLTLNVLAYLPLGLLLVIALHPRLRGLPAIIVAVAASTALSILLESLQNYLPTRIASNLDVVTNAAGAAIGAMAGALLAPSLIDRGRLQQAHQRWFIPDAAPLLLVVGLWPLAQIHPGAMLFDNGELSRELTGTLLAAFGRQVAVFDATQFAAAEVLVTTAGMLAAGAALTAAMKPPAPRLPLLSLLLAAALVAKAITYGHQFGPARTMAWLTPGAISGIAVGLLTITAATATATPRAACMVAITALLVLIAAVNIVPPNPYHAHWLSAWQPGRMRDVAAASDWLAQSWPYVLLLALLWWLRHARRQLHTAQGQ